MHHLDALFTCGAQGKSVAVRGRGGGGMALTRQRELIISSSMPVHGEPLMGASEGVSELTDGVAPCLSPHKKETRLCRSHGRKEMTCRRSNPGLPVCLAVLRQRVRQAFRRDKKRRLSASTAARPCLIWIVWRQNVGCGRPHILCWMCGAGLDYVVGRCDLHMSA